MEPTTLGEREVRPEFTGSAREYFRIWIVNLFFTLITLGIYSAWAKVRKKRYFYGSTRFDGDSFDYFGSPKAILRGRAIAFVVFVAYAFTSQLFPVSEYAFWGLALVLTPWLVMRALAFNARNSAFRGLRFDFAAKTRETVGLYLGMPLLVALTGGLAYPWFMARHRAFVASNHRFGTSGFGCELSGAKFFGIYFRGGLILLAFAVPAVAAMIFIGYRRLLPEGWGWAAYVAGSIAFYGGYAVSLAYVQARTANMFWNGVSAQDLRFRSTLSALKLAKLYVGNIVAIACTAGLLIPWAVVRTLRYRLENFAMLVAGKPVAEANPALPPVGATGQELGEIFNLDLGL
ncbi:MAG: YjgN family protein [Burkholderiales bacterium]